MTPQDMIDYVLGCLDDDERVAADGRIATDSDLAAKIECMQRRLRQLLDDEEAIEPPPDLTRRTMALVASSPTRPRRPILEFVPVTVPFRWADVAVAASIFLAGLVTLLPAVHRSKVQTDQTLCAFNLGQLGQGLSHYAATHGYYPYPPPDSPVPYAGIFKVMLNDSGHLFDPSMLDCPSNGRRRSDMPLPDYKTLCDLQQRDPGQLKKLLQCDYAYHLGYRDQAGRPVALSNRLSARVPLLGDRPEHDADGHILPGNSPNHGGVGQNVVFKDGHVGFLPTRWMGPNDRDLFLNEDKRPEPGVSPDDSVLAPGVIPFFDGH